MPLASRLHAHARVASHETPSQPSRQRAASVVARPRTSSVISAHIGAWLLLISLVPLLVNLWGQHPFELPKVMVMRTLVWLLAGGLLARGLLAYRPQPLSLRQLRIKGLNSPLGGPLLLLSLVIAVTTLTAANWRLSLWGSYSRAQGAITLLTYLLLCWFAARHLRGSVHAQQIVTTLVATALPIALFSLAQSIGWNPFGLHTDARSGGYATLGRANFVAAYLAMLAPLTLALGLMSRMRARRVGWFMLLGVELMAITLTSARSAWLATAVALGLFALIWWGKHLARHWRVLAGGGLGLLALSGPVAVLGLGPHRLDSLAARLHIWQGSWTLITQRPLLGYGADALGLTFWRVYSPQLVYTQGRNIVVDRAHNLFLDWLLIAGVPGLCAYLLVLATFVVIIWRALRQPYAPMQRALLIGILAAVTANIVNNLTSFDVTPTAMTTWLLIGLGVALATPRRLRTYPSRPSPPTTRHLWQWAVVSLLWLSMGAAIWQMNVRPLLADIATRTAQRAAHAENWPRVHIAATQAVAHWPLEPAHHILLSQSAWRLARTQADSTPWLASSEAALLEARRLRPHDPLVWQHLAQFYAAAAYQFDHHTDELAATAFQQAITLAPTHATLYVAGGKAALAEGDVSRAATLLRQAVALDSSNGDAYLALGAAEAALGRWEIALADYREAVRLLPNSVEAYTALHQAIYATQAK